MVRNNKFVVASLAGAWLAEIIAARPSCLQNDTHTITIIMVRLHM
jgi:hypothetical protein